MKKKNEKNNNYQTIKIEEEAKMSPTMTQPNFYGQPYMQTAPTCGQPVMNQYQQPPCVQQQPPIIIQQPAPQPIMYAQPQQYMPPMTYAQPAQPMLQYAPYPMMGQQPIIIPQPMPMMAPMMSPMMSMMSMMPMMNPFMAYGQQPQIVIQQPAAANNSAPAAEAKPEKKTVQAKEKSPVNVEVKIVGLGDKDTVFNVTPSAAKNGRPVVQFQPAQQQSNQQQQYQPAAQQQQQYQYQQNAPQQPAAYPSQPQYQQNITQQPAAAYPSQQPQYQENVPQQQYQQTAQQQPVQYASQQQQYQQYQQPQYQQPQYQQQEEQYYQNESPYGPPQPPKYSADPQFSVQSPRYSDEYTAY